MTGEFPNVPSEPTSLVEVKAKDGDCEAWEVIDCPECGSEAYYLTSYPKERRACRECKTGKKQLLEKSNYGKAWNKVRAWVLDRDSHQCQRCGAFFREMHIHHLEQMVWFKTTRQAHRPGNLETICRNCHNSRWRP